MGLYPNDSYQRRVARQNGALVLWLLAPLALFMGIDWFLASPSAFRFCLGVVLYPLAIVAIARWAIRWGRQSPANGAEKSLPDEAVFRAVERPPFEAHRADVVDKSQGTGAGELE